MAACIVCGNETGHYEKIGGVKVIIHKKCSDTTDEEASTEDTQDVIFKDEKEQEEVDE